MTYLVMATIPYYTNIPRDVITNTWHFDWVGGIGPLAPDYQNLENHVAAYYETVFAPAGTNSFSSFINAAGYRSRIYNLAEPQPRVPKLDQVSTLAVKEDNSLIPTEVAVVLSYRAATVSGLSQASRRGRIYLGGLSQFCVTTGGPTSFPTPSPGLRTSMANAAVALLANALADDWQWVVYSPKLNTSAPVVGGYVDDAFDTQRRRGQSPTARTLWP